MLKFGEHRYVPYMRIGVGTCLVYLKPSRNIIKSKTFKTQHYWLKQNQCTVQYWEKNDLYIVNENEKKTKSVYRKILRKNGLYIADENEKKQNQSTVQYWEKMICTSLTRRKSKQNQCTLIGGTWLLLWVIKKFVSQSLKFYQKKSKCCIFNCENVKYNWSSL